MRIGIVTGEYPPDQGGVGDFTHELGLALSSLSHEVVVLTDKTHPASPSGQNGITVLNEIEGWTWGCWRQIAEIADRLALDVLNVQYQAAAYDMHPAINFVPRPDRRPPVFVTFHDLKVPYIFPKAGPLRWWVVRRLARNADTAIVTNREDYLRLTDEMPAKRVSMIPIGSNIPRHPPSGYDRDIERAHWGVGPDDFLLGYFGFLNESKGGEELIQALAHLVSRGLSAHLLMVGGRVGSSDPTNRAYAERIDGLIAQLDLDSRVHWTQYASPKKVSAGLLAADACVLPYRDGVSFRRGTLLACLTHGRAIVTTRPVVPLNEVVEGQNMLLAPPRAPERLADAIARVAADPALRARLEAGASALAAEFTWERIARQTAALFGRVALAS
jgi:glycosyltransferase involved in cell wall biosynthesis